MRSITPLLLACSMLPLTAQANDLLRIYDLALHNDAVIAAAEHARDAATEAKPQALAAVLPQINAGYGKTRTYQDTTYGTPSPFTPSGSNAFTSSALTVSLNQTLFDLAAFQNLARADDQAALAVAGYQSVEQALILRTASAYFNVLAATDNLRSSSAQKHAVEQQLEQSQKRFEVGLSAITDVQEAQARSDLANAQVIADQQSLDIAKQSLTEIINAPVGTLQSFQEDFPLPSPDPANAETWVKNAEAGNYDVLMAQLNAEIARRTVNIAWSQHLPTIGLQGQYADSDRNGNASVDQTQKAIGAQITIPIFSGGATQSAVRQADYTYQQRQSQLESAKRSTQTQTRNAYQGVLTGAARVKALKQAVVSSSTALDASQVGLQVGARTSIDVLNAQQQLYSAQRDYAKSRYDYLLSVLNLKAAAGKLAQRDLAEMDRLLVISAGTPAQP